MQAAQCLGQAPCDQLLEACGQAGVSLERPTRQAGLMGEEEHREVPPS